MKKRNRTVEKASLPQALEKRLAVYALAAGAGMLALAAPTQASIIVDTTPISFPSSSPYLTINGVQQLDFDAVFGTGSGSLKVFSPFGNGASAEIIVAPLTKGAAIGPGRSFVSFGTLASNFPHSSGVHGPCANKTGYLGFEFKSHGHTYFGWAHLSVKANPTAGESGVISEFAYDTLPGQTIDAGQTSQPSPTPEPGSFTLSLLALGAAGLFVLRKRKLAAR
jgi:hypothetical protein